MQPPPPWYSAPSLNAPRIRRVASSCSYVNCIPRGFAPPQPKQVLVGLGVSSMFAISVRLSLQKKLQIPRFARDDSVKTKAKRQTRTKNRKPEEKEPARCRHAKT